MKPSRESAAAAPVPSGPEGTPPQGARVLVVDDERNIRHSLRVCLESAGMQVREAESGAAALKALEREPMDACFLDLRLGEESGLDVLPRLLEARPDLAVVIVTAFATIETAIEALRRGARDYLAKPFTPNDVRRRVEAALEARRLLLRTRDLEARLADALPDAELESASPAMREALDLAMRAAPSDAPILIRGESGTGKGVLARAIHARSGRREGPFVTVHCPMLTAELLASELFGHAKGAFTGALQDQAGKVDAARGGTLFLDEVSEIAPALQAKLLRFVQDQEYERVGESRVRRADVRVLAATNRDLGAAVKAGTFREDLYFRLNVIEVTIPPLRERPEDVVPLAEHFLRFLARSQRRRAPLRLPEVVRARLRSFAWPGNVRELKNALERAAILARGDEVDIATLPPAVRDATGGRAADAPGPPGSAGGGSLAANTAPGEGSDALSGSPRPGDDITIEALERLHVARVLARTETLEEAARILGIDPATLYRKRRKYREG